MVLLCLDTTCLALRLTRDCSDNFTTYFVFSPTGGGIAGVGCGVGDGVGGGGCGGGGGGRRRGGRGHGRGPLSSS